jgi:hypothetical protein
MSSKRRLRRKACGSKQRFDTEAEAIAALRALTRAKGWQGLLVPYRCAFCGHFHFGHAPANVRRRL